MTTHTKGKWKKTGEPDQMSFENESGDVIIGGCGCCGSPFGADDPDEFNANVRMIEKAPEMAELLPSLLVTVSLAGRVDLARKITDILEHLK